MVNRASVRLIAADAVRGASVWLSALLGAAVVLVGLSKAIGVDGIWIGMVVAAVAVAAAVTVWDVWRRRRSAMAAAAEVDAAMALHDRLGSAVAFEVAGESSPFASLAMRQAEAIAQGIDTASSIPIRVPRLLWVAVVLIGVAVAVGAFVPARRAASFGAVDPEAVATAATHLEAAEAAVAEAVASPDLPEEDAAVVAEQRASLESLREQLERGDIAPEEAQSLAASALEDASDELEAKARQADDAVDRVARAADGLEDVEDDRLRALAERLAAGDLEGAREAANALLDQTDAMDQATRDRLAEDLERLADRIEPGDERPSGATGSERDQLERSLIEDGVDPASAAREAERRTSEDSAADDAPLREALRDEADRLRSNEGPTTPEPTDAAPDSGNAPEESAQKEAPEAGGEAGGDTGGDRKPSDRPSDAEPPSEQPPPESGGQQPAEDSPEGGGDQRSEDKQGDGTRPEPGQGQADGPSNKQAEGEEPGDKPGEKPGGAQGSEPGGGSPGSESGKESGENPGDTPSRQGGDRPSDEGGGPSDPNADPGGSSGGAAQGEGGPSERKLDRAIRALSDKRDAANRQRQTAQRLREAAEEARGDSGRNPERATVERGDGPGRTLANDVPPPDGESGTFDAAEDIVDARDPADANGASSVEGTRGNWQDDGTRRGSGVGDSAPTPRDIADSARQAQRAIEDNRVPRRYQDLVRRVFERYKRRSDDGSVEPPPAPIGKDADDGASP